MKLCRVIGTSVSTIKQPVYEGRTVLVVVPVDPALEPHGGSFLAVDFMEAGIGDTVLLLHWTALDCHYRDRAKGEEGKDANDADEDHGWIRSPRLRHKLYAGMTVPTGDVRRPFEEPGQTPFSALQLGTGPFNPMLGAHRRLDRGWVAASAVARAVPPFYATRPYFQARPD